MAEKKMEIKHLLANQTKEQLVKEHLIVDIQKNIIADKKQIQVAQTQGVSDPKKIPPDKES